MNRTSRWLLYTAFASVAACTKHDAAAGGASSAQPVVGATIVTVETQRFVETVDAVGVVAVRPGHQASLSAPAPTRVARVFVTVGTRVRAGDPLVEFDQSMFEAAVTSAEAALAAAEQAAARAKRLADVGVLPRKDAETAVAELAAARANAATARRARELSTLRSPIAGTVTRMVAVLGANADAGQPLVDVADPSALDVLLTLSPDDAARIRVGAVATLYAGAAAAGTPVAQGRVADIAATIDTSSRGVAIRLTVASAARDLRIGETVFGRIGVGEHADAVVVPAEAIVPNGEGAKVFVVDAQGIAHAREVKIGGRSDHGVWVTEGVRAGERVVTKGAYGVDDSVKVVSGKP